MSARMAKRKSWLIPGSQNGNSDSDLEDGMKRFVQVIALVISLATLVSAGPVTFFGEDLNGNPNVPLSIFPNSTLAHDTLFANLTGVGTENFESYANGTTTPFGITFPGVGTATLTGSSDYVSVLAAGATNGFGRYPTSGTHYLEVDSSDFVIQFSAPIAAFGFFG